MNERLYELTDQYRFLEAEIESGTEGDETLLTALAEVKAKIDDKVENIGKFILSLQADITGIRSEEDRLAARRYAVEHRIDWLKGYLVGEMTVAKLDKVKRNVITVSLRTNPPSVNVTDIEALPLEYQRCIPESYVADKKLIVDHFKDTGEVIPGVEIIKDKKSVVIR